MAEQPLDPQMLARILRSMQFTGSNDGLVGAGGSLSPLAGFAGAPAYGGSMELGGGLSAHGQYQQVPNMPPQYGAALKYSRDF